LILKRNGDHDQLVEVVGFVFGYWLLHTLCLPGVYRTLSFYANLYILFRQFQRFALPAGGRDEITPL
jgi:hypothetical protein